MSAAQCLAPTPPALLANEKERGVSALPAEGKIPSLDGLRAVSFCLVFVAHCGANHVVPGSFGVTVFFFLSGYLITTLLRLEYARTGTLSFKKFYLRRALRIFPAFYVVLAFAVAATFVGLLPATATVSGIVSEALHYANYWIVANGSYDGLPRGTGVYWSLAVEEHFYLLFPAIFLGIMKLRLRPANRSLLLLSLCAMLLLWRVFLVEVEGVTQHRTNLASDTRFDSLLFGCALALYGNPALDGSRFPAWSWKYCFLPFAVIGILATFIYRDPVFRETARYTVQGLLLVPIFVCAIRYPAWLPMQPLNWAPLAYIGTLSYSLYLIHHVMIFLIDPLVDTLGAWLAGAFALLGSLAFSWALYQWVEKPCARLRKQLQA